VPVKPLAHLARFIPSPGPTMNKTTGNDPMATAFVTPLSKKAKNRMANLMESNPECIIEQHQTSKVFLTSMNGKNHFWVNLSGDKDWQVEL
jgi:hypothetical protein